MNTYHTFLFFGRSGCGKGTQAHLIKQRLESKGHEVVYVETGQELRQFAQEKNLTATMTDTTMNTGGFLPPFIPVWAWANALIRRFDGKQDLIFDGLCRRIEEAPILDGALRYYGRTNVSVIYIDVSAEWSRKHLLSRARADDTPDEIERRLTAFDHNVLPVLEYFKYRKGYDYYEINGMQSIDEVHREIVSRVWGE